MKSDLIKKKNQKKQQGVGTTASSSGNEDTRQSVGSGLGKYSSGGPISRITSRQNAAGGSFEASLPRSVSAVETEEFGSPVNDVGGELIIRSFNKFIEDQYNAISDIDSSADGMDKRIKYSSASKAAQEKIQMYRKTFSDAERVLDRETADEGLTLLTELEDVYKERLRDTSLPSAYLEKVKSGSASPAADYIEETGAWDATNGQAASVRDMLEVEKKAEWRRGDTAAAERSDKIGAQFDKVIDGRVRAAAGDMSYFEDNELIEMSAADIERRRGEIEEKLKGFDEQIKAAESELVKKKYELGWTAPGKIEYKDLSDEIAAIEEEISSLQAERDDLSRVYNRYADRYYEAENKESAARIGSDVQASALYRSIEDAEKGIQAVTDVFAGINGGASEKSAEAEEYVAEVYGIVRGWDGVRYEEDLRRLLEGLRITTEAQKENLTGYGYDYDRMKEYVQRQKTAGENATEDAEAEAYAREHPILSTLDTVVTSPVKGIEYLGFLLDNVGNGDKDGDLSGYVPLDASGMDLTRYTDTVRSVVKSGIAEKLGDGAAGNIASFHYDAGVSSAESLYRVLAFGGGTGSLFFAAGGAAASKAKEVADAGGSYEDAAFAGLAAGAAEMIFEKVSLDALLKNSDPKNIRELLVNGLKQSGVEASEEMFTEIANVISDSLILGENSEFDLSVAEYMDSGMSRDEAHKQAMLDVVGQVALSGLAGAVSGGATNTVMAGANTVRNAVSKAIGNRNNRSEELISLLEANLPDTPEAKQLVADLRAGKLQVNETAETADGRQYSFGENDSSLRYSGRSMAEDSEIYSYDFLTSLPDMDAVTLPDTSEVRANNKKIDRSDIAQKGLENARSIGREENGKVLVKNSYTGRELSVSVRSIRHGLKGDGQRIITNARLGSVIGNLVQNAVPINALHNTANEVSGTYAMASYATDSFGREFVAIITVEQNSNDVSGIEAYDITHSVSGRQKKNQPGGHEVPEDYSTKADSKISIADLLRIVNSTHQSVLSEDVLSRFGEVRNPSGYYSDRVKFSAPFYTDSPVTSPDSRVYETRDSAAAFGIGDADISVYERVAEEFGVSVRFYTADPAVEGNGFYEDGTIYVNTEASDPLDVVFAHELSHYAERAGFYKQYKELALRELVRRTGKGLGALRTEVTSRYARYGIELDSAGAEAELVAMFTQDYLLTDAERMAELVREKPSLMQRVLDFITDFLDRIGILDDETRRLDRGRRMLARALREVQRNGKSSGTVQYMKSDPSNNSSIRQQLREHSDDLSSMDPVADIVYTPTNKKALREMANEEFKKIGYRVDRQNFGVIEISDKHINEGIKYLSADGEYAALLCVPKVLKRGKIISGHADHKGRSFGTVTIAAPVSINGIVGNVGVVVKMAGKNHYHTHRILMPDGSEFVFNKNDAELRSPDMPTENGGQRPSIHSASNNSIAQDPDDVKKQYSFSSAAGSLDADAVSEAEAMEAEGRSADEIYDSTGLWRDSETERWMKDSDGTSALREEVEISTEERRRRGEVADPDIHGDVIAEAERMEADGMQAVDIYERLGLWRDSRTREWMTYEREPRYAPYAGRLSAEERAAKAGGYREDQVDVYREAVEEARRQSERIALGSENEALSAADEARNGVIRDRGDLTLDALENCIGSKVSEELEDAVYDATEALAEASEELGYLSSENVGIEDADLAVADEQRKGLEEYHFTHGNTAEITAEDEAFAYGGGENLTEEIFNELMQNEVDRRDGIVSDSLVGRKALWEETEAKEADAASAEVEEAKREAAARTVIKIVDEYGIVKERRGEIAANAGAIARGRYPLSDNARKIYDLLVRQDRNDGSFAADIEMYEERLANRRQELEMIRQSASSQAEDLAAEAESDVIRYEEKLAELQRDRDRMWNEFNDQIGGLNTEGVVYDESNTYEWYQTSQGTALGDAMFYFEYGSAAKELALNILAATNSLTQETEREDIAARILFVRREIKKQESRMDEGSIAAAERLSEVGYIESDSDDVHYLADLYTSLRCLASGEHSSALLNLGVMIDTPITRKYGNAAAFRISAVRRDRLERMARLAARRLKNGEKQIAKDIAEGRRFINEIPEGYDSDRITRFADIWRRYQSEAAQSKNIQRFRARTAEEYTETLAELIGEGQIMKLRQIALTVLTPERALRYAFGDELGTKLTTELISPVHTNEAERIRFMNRLLQAVNMRFGKISKAESADVQRLGESGATLELYDKGAIEAKNRGFGYWEYAGQRRQQFKDAVVELSHRETLEHLKRLGFDSVMDKFWMALEEDLAGELESEAIKVKEAELKEYARVKHKTKIDAISEEELKKIHETAWKKASAEVAQMRENEEKYTAGDYSKVDIKKLRETVEATSPEDVLWNLKASLDEEASRRIRKGDDSEDAKAARDIWVEEQIRRRLAIADHMRGQYNMLFDGINDMLVSHGYDPVPYRRNYFPHMQPENTSLVSKALTAFGFHPEVTELPSQLAGRTDIFKPGHRWAPFMQRRTGANTEFDAVKGFEQYLNYASDILYHMDDIQKLRALSNHIRAKHSTDEVRTQVDRLREDFFSGRIKKEELDEKRDKLLGDSKLTEDAGKFAMWLDDYTNKLAGKQAAFDRSVEHLFGRRALNAGDWLSTTFSRSSVVGNLSSALMNTSQIPMATALVGIRNMDRAMEDLKTGYLNSILDFDNRSDFLAGKKGVRQLSQKRVIERFSDKLSIPFEIADDFAVRLIQRGVFFKMVDSGVEVDEALKRSDRLTQAIMASRAKGARPLAFESRNVFAKLITTFQLETLNSLEFIKMDLPHEMRKVYGGDGEWKKKLAAVIARYFLAAWLYNMGMEQLTGRTPAPIDVIGMVTNTVCSLYGTSQREVVAGLLNGINSVEGLEYQGDKGIKQALADLSKDVLDDIPFVSNVSQLLGWSDGNMPIYDLSPLWEKVGPGLIDAFLPEGENLEEREEARLEALSDAGEGLFEMVKGLMLGGSQFYKSYSGIKAYFDGGVYNDSGDLMYPVEQGPGALIQGAIFGTSAMAATDQYYESGGRAYSEGETALIGELKTTGLTVGEAADIIDLLDEAGASDSGSSADEDDPEFTGDVYADLNEILFGDDDSDEETESSKDRAYAAMKDMGLAPEQEYLVYREKIASKKERTLLEAVESAGGNAVAVADVLGQMRTRDGKRGQLASMMDSDLDGEDAATVFYGIVASEKEREIFDMMRDEQQEGSEDIYRMLAAQKEITTVPDAEWKNENEISKSEARYDALLESSISESSKAVYYYENLAAPADVTALDELDKLGSDAGTVYRTVAEVRYADGNKGEQYGILLDSDLSEDEVYTVLKYKLTNTDDRESLDKDLDDIYAAGGTIDEYLAAKEAVYGIESDKKKDGTSIRNSKSRKMLRAIREALPDTPYKVRVVLYELCGVSESVYKKKSSGLGDISLPEFKLPEIKLPELNLPNF